MPEWDGSDGPSRFTKGKVLGEGFSCVVVRGVDQKNHTKVALKLLDKDSEQSEELFNKEFRLLY